MQVIDALATATEHARQGLDALRRARKREKRHDWIGHWTCADEAAEHFEEAARLCRLYAEEMRRSN